jgi:hypothetical protein
MWQMARKATIQEDYAMQMMYSRGRQMLISGRQFWGACPLRQSIEHLVPSTPAPQP